MTYDEALAAATASNDSDNSTFVIDKNLRTITVPSNFILGVYNDMNTQIIPFLMPRYYNGIDLSEYSIRINYINAMGSGDIFAVYDKETDEDSITFTWTVNRLAYLYPGYVNFVVCLIKVDSESHVTNEFNTTKTAVPVLEGLEVSDPVSPNIVTSYLAQLQAYAERAEAAVDEAETAITYYPTIVDGYWCVWDVPTEQYVSTGVEATGVNYSISYNATTEALVFTPTST